eukprot:1158966-Pelagomonas_calceolata.AAC.6
MAACIQLGLLACMANALCTAECKTPQNVGMVNAGHEPSYLLEQNTHVYLTETSARHPQIQRSNEAKKHRTPKASV